MRESIKVITSGMGLWSEAVKEVICTGFSVPYTNEEGDFGELRVIFDTETWNVETDGLIYTDPAFLAAIRMALGTNDIEYSEQGMQGSNFVSFDVGQEFLTMYGSDE